jgi:3-deoxy-D-manno-octulosonic-acid transferase
MMWWLYRILSGTALGVWGPLYGLRRRADLAAIARGRLARSLPRVEGAPLWIHAVSVGEVAVAATFAAALPPSCPLVVTTVTPTGQARARAAFRDRAVVTYLPFDLGGPVRRFLDATAPRALLLVEGDYWPYLLATCAERAIPIGVVNARVGDRSFGRLRRLGPLLNTLHRRAGRIAAQSGLDAERLVALGVPESAIAVTGNLKFDAPVGTLGRQLEEALRQLAAGRPIVVAGSTMLGEEADVVAAYQAVGGGRRALLVLAPRHPERFGEVAAMLGGLDAVRLQRRSQLTTATGADVVLLDTLGELAGVYACADIAFVGGTLVPKGGHNPIEPAVFGVAVTAGTSFENFRDVAAQFERARAWRLAADRAQLGEIWEELLANPPVRQVLGTAARELVASQRGATQRSLAHLASHLGVV